MASVLYTPYGLRLGTIIATWIGPVEHFGFVCGYTAWGEPIIASISMRAGYTEVPLTRFAEAQGKYTCDYPSSLSEYEVLARAYSVANEPYNLTTWNCEHFVRYAHKLPLQSPQVARAALVAFAAVAIVALSRAA